MANYKLTVWITLAVGSCIITFTLNDNEMKTQHLLGISIVTWFNKFNGKYELIFVMCIYHCMLFCSLVLYVCITCDNVMANIIKYSLLKTKHALLVFIVLKIIYTFVTVLFVLFLLKSLSTKGFQSMALKPHHWQSCS